MKIVERVSCPPTVEEILNYLDISVTEGGFFDNPSDFPPDYKEQGRANLWNIASEIVMKKFLAGNEDYTFSYEEMEKILTTTVIQTNLDSLMNDGNIDGIENEEGEMVYWLTEKGKQNVSNLGLNEPPQEIKD